MKKVRSSSLMLAALVVLAVFGTSLALTSEEADALASLITAWPVLKTLAVPWDPNNLYTACASDNVNTGNWSGIACLNGNIDKLTLPNIALNAPIPAGIGGLTYLSEIQFSQNGLSGTIPPEFNPTTYMRHIEILAQNPGLTGTIPSVWSGFTNIQYVDLSGNKLNGDLPISLFVNKVYLYNLGLWNNKFTGTIPPSIAQVFSLQGLYLSNNLLTGTIPKEIGQLSSLTQFTIANNALNVCPTNISMASPRPLTSSNCAINNQSVQSCGCAAAWGNCNTDVIPECPPETPVEPVAPTPSSATGLVASTVGIIALILAALAC